MGLKTGAVRNPHYQGLAVNENQRPYLLFIDLVSLILSICNKLVLPSLRMRVDQPFIQHLLPIVHNLLYFRIIGQIDGDGINDESNKTAPPPTSTIRSN